MVDKRYHAVGALITSGYIKSFGQIWEHIPRSLVYKRMGMNYTKFARLVNNPQYFTLKELSMLARFFGIDGKILVDMAWADADKKRKT